VRAYVDASVLIALGRLGELPLLTNFDATPAVLPAVQREVTGAPERLALERFLDATDAAVESPDSGWCDRASNLLRMQSGGDVELVAAVLAADDVGRAVAVVSDDRRVRTTTDGLGAEVTGTVGVIVRAVAEGRSVSSATELLDALAAGDFYLPPDLRQRAMRRIERVAAERDGS
jgi:predicted nucleic acid-binding protein